MFCHQCGKENPDTSNFCKACGQNLRAPAASEVTDREQAVVRQEPAVVTQEPAQEAQPTQSVESKPAAVYIEPGFSDNENDESIFEVRGQKTKNKLRAGLFIGALFFAGILAIWVSQEGFTLDAFKIALIFGAIPVVISLPFAAKDLMDKTWEGTVRKVKSKKHTHSRPDIDEDRHAKVSYSYIVKIKLDGFGSKKLEYSHNEVSSYYRPGDRVKKHKGFEYLEKYDKNQDEYIRCIDCFNVNNKKRSHCKDCGLILMK